MIRNKTTLVLGAGASAPYGYPVGGKLSELLVQESTIRRLSEMVQEGACREFQERFGNSSARSIDFFVALNPRFEMIARLAIALVLTEFQHPTRLHGDWYSILWNQLLSEETPTHRLSIVTFNYDRSLELFLIRCILASFGWTLNDWQHRKQARSRFDELVEIVHIYGDLGPLPELDPNGTGIPYSANHGQEFTSSKSLNLIGREANAAKNFERAKEMIAEANYLSFLGFGYLEENVAGLDFASLFGNELDSP